jgi:hypothetical protein
MELGSEFRAHTTGDGQCFELFDPDWEITLKADSGRQPPEKEAR